MKVKAKVSFSGIVSMGLGEVREIDDEEVLRDLLRAGYVEEAEGKTSKAEKADKPDKPKKKVKPDESK